MAYALWQDHLRFDPDLPVWANRDRFVLSVGHASTLLYAMLHLSGVKSVNPDYETLGEPAVSLDDLRRFRQLDSKCPGHPEYRWTSGVECTTGPLGTGIATSVGMAIAGLWQAATFNRPDYELFDYDVYALAGDGCLMEGIGSEAASLAGHLRLSNLCWIYDNNKITIEGSTGLAFSEDVATRFAGYGWAVQHVTDANDLDALDEAFDAFRAETVAPDSDHRRQRHRLRRAAQARHARRARRTPRRGRGPGREAVLRLAGGRDFRVPDEGARTSRAGCGSAGGGCGGGGRSCSPATPPSTRTWPTSSTACSAGRCPTGGTPTCPSSRPTRRGVAGRDANGKVLNAVAQRVPWLIGGLVRPRPVEQVPAHLRGAGDFSADDRAGPQPALRGPRARGRRPLPTGSRCPSCAPTRPGS